jgi:hypothetical protein
VRLKIARLRQVSNTEMRRNFLSRERTLNRGLSEPAQKPSAANSASKPPKPAMRAIRASAYGHEQVLRKARADPRSLNSFPLSSLTQISCRRFMAKLDSAYQKKLPNSGTY